MIASHGHAWIGYTDVKDEGKFIDVNTGQEMKWFTWDAEPSGGPEIEEDCVGLTSLGKMFDASCSWIYCTLCHLEKEPVLHLRGACPESGLDLDYTMKKENGKIRFRGWRKTKLVSRGEKWSLVEERRYFFSRPT